MDHETEDPRTAIGVLHPGAMGVAVAASAATCGNRVMWVAEGRSKATHQRADAAGLEELAWLNSMVNQADMILSICPPESAYEVAEDVRNLGYQGIYVDANAISPETTRRIGTLVEGVGAEFVDGGIIGGPPWKPGISRLYLSGEAAPKVARAFEGGPLEVIVLDAPVGAASALKMAYASWTKGTSALLTAVQALAIQEGVLEPLRAEWSRGGDGLLKRADGLGTAAAKAWRWVGEMEEIAVTYAGAGLPDGFHLAAAEVYRRLAEFKDDPNAPGGEELAKHLLK